MAHGGCFEDGVLGGGRGREDDVLTECEWFSTDYVALRFMITFQTECCRKIYVSSAKRARTDDCFIDLIFT